MKKHNSPGFALPMALSLVVVGCIIGVAVYESSEYARNMISRRNAITVADTFASAIAQSLSSGATCDSALRSAGGAPIVFSPAGPQPSSVEIPDIYVNGVQTYYEGQSVGQIFGGTNTLSILKMNFQESSPVSRSIVVDSAGGNYNSYGGNLEIYFSKSGSMGFSGSMQKRTIPLIVISNPGSSTIDKCVVTGEANDLCFILGGTYTSTGCTFFPMNNMMAPNFSGCNSTNYSGPCAGRSPCPTGYTYFMTGVNATTGTPTCGCACF